MIIDNTHANNLGLLFHTSGEDPGGILVSGKMGEMHELSPAALAAEQARGHLYHSLLSALSLSGNDSASR